MPSPLFMFYFSSIFLFQTQVTTAAKIDTSCSTFSSGNFKNITYPFSNLHTQQSFCGHPKFKVVCQPGKLTLVIKSQKFIILKLNQTSQSLTIACIKDNKFQISYSVLSSRIQDFILLNCTKNITVIGLNTSITNNNLTLEEGFEIRWRGVGQDMCVHCIRSGERRGYNTSQNAVLCISTKNPMVPSTLVAPTSEGTWKWKKALIIGGISSVLATLVLITSVYHCLRLNNNSTAESHIHSARLSLHDSQRLSRSKDFRVQHFIYGDLERATNFFSIENRIRDGGSGDVYRGKN